jgi:hypothetical protein
MQEKGRPTSRQVVCHARVGDSLTLENENDGLTTHELERSGLLAPSSNVGSSNLFTGRVEALNVIKNITRIRIPFELLSTNPADHQPSAASILLLHAFRAKRSARIGNATRQLFGAG